MGDPFNLDYQAWELRIAAKFLTDWLPFLKKGLCSRCMETLSNRIRLMDPDSLDGVSSSSNGFANLIPNDSVLGENCDSCNAKYTDSLKDSVIYENQDSRYSKSVGSWKHTASGSSEVFIAGDPTIPVRTLGANMAQEDEHEDEVKVQEDKHRKELSAEEESAAEEAVDLERQKKSSTLSRHQREFIRFMHVERKKDFVCYERINGRQVNILDGLELHTGVFTAVEQKRIVDCIYALQEMGKKGELRERTYSEPRKWMRGKGRATIQFGCCYNYATDKKGNPAGILRSEHVDAIPPLLKVIIRRLVGWHVLPPSCIPDSCIVNIYEEGDCIPPHIDNHDFVRPFCTVSFLSECSILFGSNLNIVGPGEFFGSIAIPLPVGSVLVFNGNGANVAEHCVPGVPSKRISITFRKMDKRKRPYRFVAERDLREIQPLPYASDSRKRFKQSHTSST